MVGLSLVKQALSGPQPSITALVLHCSLQSRALYKRLTWSDKTAGRSLSWFRLNFKACATFPPPLVCPYSVQPPHSGESCCPKGKHPGLNTPTSKFSQNEGMLLLVSSLCSLLLSKGHLCICACFNTHTHSLPHPHILPDLPTETSRQRARRSQLSGLKR